MAPYRLFFIKLILFFVIKFTKKIFAFSYSLALHKDESFKNHDDFKSGSDTDTDCLELLIWSGR